MRATLDANVLVSGIAGYTKAQSAPARALIAAIDGQYTLVISEFILTEVMEAFSKPYFQDRLDEAYVAGKMSDVRRIAKPTVITEPVERVASHWQDDLVLATALSGHADVLVTGDRELRALDHPFPFPIVHPNQFLILLESGAGNE